MGRNNRKRRSSLANRAIAASAALALGGGGLIWANFYASAHETNSSQNNSTKAAAAQIATISCPDVSQQLTSVPSGAKSGVDTELATLDKQITEAYSRLASTRQAQAGDANFVQNAILGPLKDKRTAVIQRIQIDFKRVGATAPSSLPNLATCTGAAANNTTTAGNGNGNGNNNNGNGNNGNGNNGQGQASASPSASASASAPANVGGQGGNGPVAADFVDITKVAANVQAKPQNTGNASKGSFTTICGTGNAKLRNSDNVIVAPGVDNGAHHTHDYVGNQDNNAFTSDQQFEAAGTSCQEQEDKSTYYWPVVRVQDGSQEIDQNDLGGGAEGNVGRIVQASQAQIKFVGSPASKVVAMPTALRIITGDAKAFVNGTANANAHWSCTGFENKVQLTDQYPICPQGSKVVRTFAFQSCWDGKNADSANHRTHVAFADPASGVCGNGFVAIPQLTMRLVYNVPAPTIQNGQVKNAYAVDGFPEELHKPITDHDDFINFMSTNLMNKVVGCINKGKNCT
ncbi:protein of unknown function DUF1996-containing protein [Actinobacteria bacterium OK074]|nr:protein of unknown function DUF1996-containing protein [Actinobacteria bacterium OK074]